MKESFPELEVIASHCVDCRGVSLNHKHRLEPVLNAEKCVQAIVDKFRDGTTRVACIHLGEKFSCTASASERFRDEIVFPGCIYGPTATANMNPEGESVLSLNLSNRASRRLEIAHIQTVEQLCEFTADQLREVRNLGDVTLNELREKLAKKGLALKGEKAKKSKS